MMNDDVSVVFIFLKNESPARKIESRDGAGGGGNDITWW